MVRLFMVRALALALIVAVFVPTVSQIDIDVAAASPAHHGVVAAQADGRAPSPFDKSRCCIESLQHCWYRTADADALAPIVRRPALRMTFAVADEWVRSRDPDPLRKPPRA